MATAELELSCPYCGKEGRVPPGAHVRCRGCRGTFQVEVVPPLPASSAREAAVQSPPPRAGSGHLLNVARPLDCPYCGSSRAFSTSYTRAVCAQCRGVFEVEVLDRPPAASPGREAPPAPLPASRWPTPHPSEAVPADGMLEDALLPVARRTHPPAFAIPWEREGAGASEFWETWRKVMGQPGSFFQGLIVEASMVRAMGYLLLVAIVPFYAIVAALGVVIGSLAGASPGSDLGPILGGAAGLALVYLLLTHVAAGFFHLSALLVGGGGAYGRTYRAFAYACSPLLLLWACCLPAVVSVIFFPTLLTYGLAQAHGISKARAFGAMVIAMALMTVLGIWLGEVLD